MKLSALLSGVEVKTLCADPEREIPTVVSDSRKAGKDSLFLCLSGQNRDGHCYIENAVTGGAYAALVEKETAVPLGVPYITVSDTRLAAAQIFNNFFGDPAKNMRVVAITGTNGKTSTAFYLYHILKEAGYRVGLVGTVKCLCMDQELDLSGGGETDDIPAAMTTPDPRYLYGAVAEMEKAGVEILILEITSHALALHKPDALRPELSIFTNLSPEHLDYHGTMDEYFLTKARLFSFTKQSIVNVGDPWGKKLADLLPVTQTVRCLANDENKNSATVTARQIESHGVSGMSYIYYSEGTAFRLFVPVPGMFSVENSLLAATAALRLQVDPVTIQQALARFSGVEGRLQRVELPDAPFSLFLDYAHTPAALESLLKTVREARRAGEKITLLFGCGGDRDPSKRPAMGRIASALADFVILTADNSRTEKTETILKEILRGIDKEKPHTVIPDRRAAIQYAIREARAGDILLFAGKGHEKYEITQKGKTPFSEADIAKAAWAAVRESR